LLSLSPLVLSPIFASNPSAQSRTKEIGMWYNLLLSWPVFATCFWINVGPLSQLTFVLADE
jgi:etoposide-induced 2.4 mRNA